MEAMKRIILIAVLLLTATLQMTARSRAFDKYTKQRPLVIATDWEFPPYSYLDNKGKLQGYNIDVLNKVLENLQIPHVYRAMEWTHVIGQFAEQKADLIVLKSKSFTDSTFFVSHVALTNYRHGIAHRAETPSPTSIKDIRKKKSLAFKTSDWAAVMARQLGMNPNTYFECTPHQAFNKMQKGEIDYFVYGEEPLKWFVKEWKLSNIVVNRININSSTFHCISRDQALITAIDDELARLDLEGELKSIHNKWFNPFIYYNNASPIVFYVILGILIIVVTVLIMNKVTSNRIRRNFHTQAENNLIIQKALSSSTNLVIRYDIKSQMIYNVYGTLLPKEGMTAEEFCSRIHPDDSQEASQKIYDMIQGETSHYQGIYRWNKGSIDTPVWRFFAAKAIMEQNAKGKAISIINTILDMTEDRLKEAEEERLTERFSNVFTKTFIGLSLYHPDGKLIMVNKAMRDIFHFENDNDQFYFDYNLYDLPFIKEDIKWGEPRNFHFCTQIHIPERNMYDYLEIKMRPTYDEETGKLQFVVLTARNESEAHRIYQQSRENEVKLKTINERVNQYESNLRYLLEENKMRVWRSSLQDQTVTYFKDLHTYDLKISFDDFMRKVQTQIDSQEYHDVLRGKTEQQIHKSVVPVMNLFVMDNKIHWYAINSMPEYDEKGQMTGYFGLIRDITLFMDKQDKLKEETLKANESGRQKSVFLANMTHEIRTPLNAIVGFCDLLQAIDDKEEKMEFTRIIRKNCNLLLQLINDILDISAIDSNGQLVHPRPTDFAQDFNDMCLSLRQRVDNPKVQFVAENPYETLPAVIDSARIQQVVTNFVTNAVKYTEEGFIKVGYNIMKDGLYIYCSDTGCGIPKEKCQTIFGRFVKLNDFVQGTGLGLSICKTISEQCNGKIGVDSEVGKGSTFWIWVPYR